MFSNKASSPPKGSVPIRTFMWSGSLCCFMIRVLQAIMHISTKGINTFAKQTKIPAKEFKLKHFFHPG